MTSGGGGEDPPSPQLPSVPINSGEFLLRLVQNAPHMHLPDTLSSPTPAQQRNAHCVSLDPAVAAVGPSIPLPINNSHDRPSLTLHHPWPPTLSPPNNSNNSFSPPYPHNFFRHDFPHNPSSWPHHQSSPPPQSNISFPHQQINVFQQQQQQQQHLSLRIPNERDNSASRINHLRERESGFVSGNRTANGYEPPRSIDPRMNSERHKHTGNGVYGSPDMRRSGPPPGFTGTPMSRRTSFEHNAVTEMSSSLSEKNRRGSRFGTEDYEGERRFSSGTGSSNRYSRIGLSGQLDRPGHPVGSALHSILASGTEQSLLNLNAEVVDIGEGDEHRRLDKSQHCSNGHEGYHDEINDLGEQLVESLILEHGSEEKKDKKKHCHRDKDFRSDARGQRMLNQRMRNFKRFVECRNDIDRLNAPFLAIYNSLIPPAEEKAKQKQLLTLLEKLVCKEWSTARLYLYGSCANSFGVSKSDIDVCLAIDEKYINKSEVLLRLAEILQSDNLQDVQALTRARVPIVKLKDPVTGLSCDICINNVLAVVNTKLLRDYAEIDVRLRQLAFIVKHWAKSRGVNETYQGTLSSYAYVLMCIHFLQQRRPAILPCLQEMEATYVVTVDDIKCAYFDEVEKLRHFGAGNTESIAHLVWAFFNYWAYCHDYANSVISVRSGSILSKQGKDWTRRIGNDRHLICIEDPFETSHDLGRVVDKNSIRVLREEFERAAEIMQHAPNPCMTLFEPYVPR